MPEHGTVLAVQSRRLGDELVGAHSAGATVLQVDDVADFSEEGGWISTPAGVQAYSTINDAASTISLTAGLLGALADADRVDLYDVEQAQTIVEVIASVQVDGAEVNSDPVEAIVHHTLVALLPEGIRAEAGESVEFEHDATADVSTITNVLGKSPSIDGAAVWNPYVIQAMNALTVPDSSFTQVTSWTVSEAVGLATGSGITITYPGVYYIAAQNAWATNSSGRRYLRILINGSQVGYVNVVAETSGVTYVQVFALTRLEETDVVTVELQQTSGASLAIGLGVSVSRMVMYRVSI
jgi:hypothetical protein